VSHNGRRYPNEAWTRDRLGGPSDNSLQPRAIVDQLSSIVGRRAGYVCVERQRLQGLIGARRRGSRQAWEIDYLIDATRDRTALPSLLDCAAFELGSLGAEKVFLRLDAGSESIGSAREGGFMPYQEETLYRREPRYLASMTSAPLRPVTPADSYPLYRLYNDSTPETARRIEAATYGEWSAGQDRAWLGKRYAQLVLEADGRILGLVQAARQPHAIVLDLLVDGTKIEDLGAVIDSASATWTVHRRPCSSSRRRVRVWMDDCRRPASSRCRTSSRWRNGPRARSRCQN